MTVKELIEKLREFPEDLEIITWVDQNPSGMYYDKEEPIPALNEETNQVEI